MMECRHGSCVIYTLSALFTYVFTQVQIDMSFIAPGVKFFCLFICSRVTYQPAKSIASIRGQSTVHMCHWEKAGKQGVKEARSREESEGGKGGGVK